MSRPQYISESELEAQFAEEFRVLAQAPRIAVIIAPAELWALMAIVQFACRHPKFSGTVRETGEGIARQFQARLAGYGPALAAVAERGWHPEFDEESRVTHE